MINFPKNPTMDLYVSCTVHWNKYDVHRSKLGLHMASARVSMRCCRWSVGALQMIRCTNLWNDHPACYPSCWSSHDCTVLYVHSCTFLYWFKLCTRSYSHARLLMNNMHSICSTWCIQLYQGQVFVSCSSWTARGCTCLHLPTQASPCSWGATTTPNRFTRWWLGALLGQLPQPLNQHSKHSLWNAIIFEFPARIHAS